MSSTSSVNEPLPTHLEIPYEGRTWRFWFLAGLAVAVAVAGVAWKTGFLRPNRLWARPAVATATLVVDEGEIDAIVTEFGSLESSNNATIRCNVEALIGMVGGASQQGGGAGGGGRAGGGTAGGAGGAGQGGGQQAQAQPAPATKKTQTTAGGASGQAGGAAGSTLLTGTQPAANAGAGGGAGGSGGAGGGGGGATVTPAAAKPVIRSFTYVVPPYVPLRPKAPGTTKPIAKAVMADPSAGGGGGRRGGGGGGGGGNANQEKPGSTRIISILPEGTHVKPGDIVCELDSSAFRDELQAQKIRWAQAKTLVEQARAIHEVNEITLQEYRDGIYPQDVQLVRQYLATCEIDADRARKNLKWSRETFAMGYRTDAQVKADTATTEQAERALREARGMLSRLEKYTGPRLTKNLMAKIEAIKADKLAQDSVYQLESDRLRRLEEMVANCTLRAPRDGIVVYANQANGWGQVQTAIDEGVTVRQGQAIVNLPDPKHMRVRVGINESKVSSVRAGQKALIRIDAFPGRPLNGVVEAVTPIPAPPTRGGQDVRVYYATVEITSAGFDELRPGLSAEVTFQVEEPRRVTRVPLQAVRWVKETPFVAVAEPRPAGDPADGPTFQWRRLKLGQSDTRYIEVVSGLRPGDRVVARPDRLAAPTPAVAGAAVGPSDAPRG